MGDPYLVAAVVFMGCAVAGTLLHLGGTFHFKADGRLYSREDLLVQEIKEMRKEIQQLKKKTHKQ